MIFLQLTLSKDTAAFHSFKWVEALLNKYPAAEVMEADNLSEVYLYQQILKWVLQSSEPLVLHIHSLDSESSTGNILRVLQDLIQKKPPVLITMQGVHVGVAKYINAFSEYTVVETEEEAVRLIELKA
jgi:hypothetical protein